MKPKFLNLIQGTDEWLEWRKSGVGASLVSTLIDCNPYKTKYVAWGEILGFWEEDDLTRNPNIIRGNRYENEGSLAFQQQIGRSFFPVCVESAYGAPFIASLDGYNQLHNEVLEIKCPHPYKWKELVSQGRLSKAYRLYYSQVQYQLFVTNAEIGYLAFYNVETKELLTFKIKANTAYQEWLAEIVNDFYVCCRDIQPPELDKQRDVVTPAVADGINVDEWLDNAHRLVKLLAEQKALNAKAKAVKAKINDCESTIIDMLGGFRKGEIEGVKLTYSERAPRVDYKAAYLALVEQTGDEVDLTDYQGDPSYSYRVSIDKKSGEQITEKHIQAAKARIQHKISFNSAVSQSVDSLHCLF